MVGGIFDLAKALLPVALLVFASRRAFFSFAIIGSAWVGLVTYSWLATHATVSAAIATIERNGTWKMESRTNAKSELTDLEQRLVALSQPLPPRPSKSVTEALASERVPVGIWQDSQECSRIRESRYFERACSKVLELRRERAAAQDYEKIEARVGELRHALAAAPIVATQDPLPRAFTATIGRLYSTRWRRWYRSPSNPGGRDHELLWACRRAGPRGGAGEGEQRSQRSGTAVSDNPRKDDPRDRPWSAGVEPLAIVPEGRQRWRAAHPEAGVRPSFQCGPCADAAPQGVGVHEG